MKKSKLKQLIKEILDSNSVEQKIQDYISKGNRGNLDLKGAKITKLPDNLTKVIGTLDISDSNITSLPPNFRVSVNLKMQNTPITKLPDNLSVGYSIYATGSKLSEVPNNLYVGRWFFADNTPLKSKYKSDIALRNAVVSKGGIIVLGDFIKSVVSPRPKYTPPTNKEMLLSLMKDEDQAYEENSAWFDLSTEQREKIIDTYLKDPKVRKKFEKDGYGYDANPEDEDTYITFLLNYIGEYYGDNYL